MRYAQPGRFQRLPDDPLYPRPGMLEYQAVCGACGRWETRFIAEELLDRAAVPLTPAACFEHIGWSIQEGRIRCAFCTGVRVRPPGAPLPLPEPKSPQVVTLGVDLASGPDWTVRSTREVRP